MNDPRILKIHPKDNVAIALENLYKGEILRLNGIKTCLMSDIPAKHKYALQDLQIGADIIMYGILVGRVCTEIPKGGIISTDNTFHHTDTVTGKTTANEWNPPDISQWKSRTFMGFPRKDGQVGTENIWLFFPLVFCENRNIKTLQRIFEQELNPPKKEPLRQVLSDMLYPGKKSKPEEKSKTEKHPLHNIKLRFLTHEGGCGGTRQDSETLARLLAGYVNNPNVAGATILSLGCQHLQIESFKKTLKTQYPKLNKPLLFFDQQTEGTVDTLLERVIKETFTALTKANEQKREPTPLSKLTIGLECGGSDGFSGITANPTLGQISDLITALGGKTLLAEFPELCGVEQELANRCLSEEMAQKFLQLMQDYESAAKQVGSGFDRNPSPGNIKDGLITDAIKSAGAAKKGGASPVKAVLDYTEYATENGLSLLNTPGNDVESTTALAASGANIILFTTGLGTPTGNPICPVIKVATNTALTQKMPDIIDFDCGPIITENQSHEDMGAALLEVIIAVASGKKITRAEALGQFDFIPWKRGVSL